jgi:hypothetical protein
VLKARLEQRYGSERSAEVFKARLQNGGKRQPGEDLSKLRDSLWLLTRKGYPRLPRDSQEQIALDALMRSVDSDLRVQCSMKECRNLDEAVAVMQRFEAVVQVDPEHKRKAVKRFTENVDTEPRSATATVTPQAQGLTDLCEKLAGLLSKQIEFLADLRKEQDRPRFTGRPRVRDLQDVECFHCHEKGHYSRECPKKVTTPTQGTSGNAVPLAGR